jgi:hypothetical protein
VALTWSTDVSAGAWLTERIIGFARDVGSVVPHGFEAYARVFHPLDDGRWADRAARNGRIAHAEMQLHLISSPAGAAPAGYQPLDEGSVGSLPEGELEALVAVLRHHTAAPERAWFAVWGAVRPPPRVASRGALHDPGRPRWHGAAAGTGRGARRAAPCGRG